MYTEFETGATMTLAPENIVYDAKDAKAQKTARDLAMETYRKQARKVSRRCWTLVVMCVIASLGLYLGAAFFEGKPLMQFLLVVLAVIAVLAPVAILSILPEHPQVEYPAGVVFAMLIGDRKVDACSFTKSKDDPKRAIIEIVLVDTDDIISVELLSFRYMFKKGLKEPTLDLSDEKGVLYIPYQ